MLESLTAIYIESHQCPSYQSILLTQSVKCPWKIFENWQFWKTQFFWVNHFDFFFDFFFLFCFIHMKISPYSYGRMDGSRFWCFSWFPENSLLCTILRYTVYLPYAHHHKPLLIASRSWIQAIHKDRIFWKNLPKNKEMVFENGVKNLKAAAHNGARTVSI